MPIEYLATFWVQVVLVAMVSDAELKHAEVRHAKDWM